MKKYVSPAYNKEVIETGDIMAGSIIVSQDGDTTNSDMSADSLFGNILNAIGIGK